MHFAFDRGVGGDFPAPKFIPNSPVRILEGEKTTLNKNFSLHAVKTDEGAGFFNRPLDLDRPPNVASDLRFVQLRSRNDIPCNPKAAED